MRINTEVVENIYPDEQEKLDVDFKREVELTLKMQALLDGYGYELIPTLVNGLPEISLKKV